MSPDGPTWEWDEKPNHHCGVVGVAATEDVAGDIFLGLRILQHRGQEAAGIAVHDGEMKFRRGMGLVHEVFSKENLVNLKGRVGIGHVRYSTTGTSTIENAQPVVVSSAAADIALAHNGDIVNAGELKEELQERGWAFMTSTDTEVVVRLLANEISETRDVVRALKNLAKKLVGSYSLVILVGGRVFALRDPLAIRPLCLGRGDGVHMVASESIVFDTLGLDFVRDVGPGEIVELTPEAVMSHRIPAPQNPAHCMFEWVYFSRADSIVDGRLVYDVRQQIGRELAREHPVEADMVVPVPDSGRAHAFGYAEKSGLPYLEGLMKNRYIDRTFIMPEQEDRDLNVLLKLNPVRSVVGGKRVVLVDDSIVRGTTMRKIVSILRKGGAKEVHVRIGCPPIRAPCYLGIDMKTRNQFAANERTVKGIGDMLGADSLGYVSIAGLLRSLGLDEQQVCLGCLTARYPVEVPGEAVRFQKRLDAFAEAEGKVEAS
jgi:amidophosphoribosyltransferase